MSTAHPNQPQFERWNAPNQASFWIRREQVTSAVTPHLLEALALQAGERVLEIGSGGGLVAIAAARAVGEAGAVTGFDISAPLTELARQRAADAGCANVRFATGDAQTGAFPGAPFDVVTSQFGVMFFGDPVAAFRNIAAQLRPGARLVFACWGPAQENAWYPGRILAQYQAPPAAGANGGPPPGPFAFADPAYVRDVLQAAGFNDVRTDLLAIEAVVSEDAIADRATVDALKVDARTAERVWAELQAHVEPLRRDDGMLSLRLAPQIVRARLP